jgi:hypothetical protein
MEFDKERDKTMARGLYINLKTLPPPLKDIVPYLSSFLYFFLQMTLAEIPPFQGGSIFLVTNVIA